jgi:hypothetical protein
MAGDTKSAERADLHDLLDEMERDFKTSTAAEFQTVGNAMIDAGMTEVADKLRSLKSAMANEYGD